jgi:predicted secreted acid phosphatase
MLKRYPWSVLTLGLALAIAGCSSPLIPTPATAVSPEPTNLSIRKRQVVAYVNSGQYAQEIARVALEANKHLAKRAPKLAAANRKLAVVFDIDETTLTNYQHVLSNDFGYVPKIWDSWVDEGRAHAIIPVQTVYDTAVRMKIDVFFITGRKESGRVATERNLREVGYETWTGIYYLPEKYEGSTRGFKTGIRRKLAADGYLILANIGDQLSDLEGGYAEKTFKLPNPFYLID